MAKELWQCPKCEERFTTSNQWHSCGSFELAPLFSRSEPHVRELFDEFVKVVENCGPVKVIPQKTRIALQVRMRFAAIMPLRTALKGHLVLSQRIESVRFEKVETYSPRNHVHVFRLISPREIDEEFVAFVSAAYDVGCQKHLETSANRALATGH